MKIIDKLVEQWHQDFDCKVKAHDYIGITPDEYTAFKASGTVPDRLPELAKEWKSGPVTPAKRLC